MRHGSFAGFFLVLQHRGHVLADKLDDPGLDWQQEDDVALLQKTVRVSPKDANDSTAMTQLSLHLHASKQNSTSRSTHHSQLHSPPTEQVSEHSLDANDSTAMTQLSLHLSKQNSTSQSTQHSQFDMLDNPTLWLESRFGHGVVSFLTIFFGGFILMTVRDLRHFLHLSAASCEKAALAPTAEKAAFDGRVELISARQGKWTVPTLIALTSYRFYTGYLSATWLPYLLAMEGQDLWAENQSLFMGVAKLIYGATILLNPLFGLIGDRAVMLSHGTGRRLFVCAGVCVACCGILLCIVAGRVKYFYSFVFGIMLWRLGEALNDVTTEALVPEMVPEDQYQLGSAIKSSMFLFGGLFGYVLLMALPGVHYSWLYYSYLAGMFICSIPSLILLSDDAPSGRRRRQGDESFGYLLVQAYVTPTTYKGGFCRACLSVFVFSLGTAPMFFLLLILRDLVGVSDPVKLQQQFSSSSIVFFLAAAAFSVATSLNKQKLPDPTTEENKRIIDEARKRKVCQLCTAMAIFGMVILAIPLLSLLKEVSQRIIGFYVLAVCFGGAFGSAFSRFQDCTWSEIPESANMANALGFNVMSRLLGVGLGNFIAGVILDCFSTGEAVVASQGPMPASLLSLQVGFNAAPREMTQVYSPVGYTALCGYCGVLVLFATWIAWDALKVVGRKDAL